MTYIGLISDTHGTFGDEFRKFFDPVDQVWHAGDFGGGLTTAQEIAAFKPLVGVYGNCDDRALRFDYPEYKCFECEQATVLMMHIGGSPGHYYPEAKRLIEIIRPDIFVCGHSHILRVEYDRHYSMMYLNPGAAGLQGWQQYRTALRFRISGRDISDMEVLKLPR